MFFLWPFLAIYIVLIFFNIGKINFETFVSLLVIAFLSIGMPCIGYYMDKKNWNNGVCIKCGKGFWKSFDVDSSSAVGYKCTNCNASHWQNGWYNKQIDKRYG